MTEAFLAVAIGLLLLAWSADRFVEGAAVTARYFGTPPLLIGMVLRVTHLPLRLPDVLERQPLHRFCPELQVPVPLL